MKVYVKTAISPEFLVYDTERPGERGIIARILNPVIILRDDAGKDLFVYGEYKASMVWSVLILGAAFFLVLKILKR